MRRFRVTLGADDRVVTTPEPRQRAQRRPPPVGTIVLPLGYQGTVASLGAGSGRPPSSAGGGGPGTAAEECCG